MDSTDALFAKLEHLERQFNRLRAGALIMCVSLAALAASGVVGRPEKSVVAEQFRVQDGEGRIRATFGLEGESGPSLTILGRDGKSNATIALQSNGLPELTLCGQSGSKLLEIYVGDDGVACLTEYAPDGAPRLSLCNIPGVGAGLGIRDRAGKVREESCVDKDDTPCLRMFVGDTVPRVSIWATRSADGHMVFHDKDGKVLASVPR